MTTPAEVEARVNLNSLRHQDAEVVEILDHAVSVALYMWDVENNSWTKPEMEGTLFVYSRRVAPFAGFTIMNRLSINNLSEKITGHMNVHIKAPFLLYQSGDMRTVPRGIWFYNQYDCIRITKLIQKYIGTKEPVSDTMSVEPVFEPISNSESSEEKESHSSCKDDLMLIMGKKAAKSPKTKPTEFLKAKSPKSSPKSVPIPPLTPGKKVDLNLLFSSQFTPIKPATPVQNIDTIEHPYPTVTHSSYASGVLPGAPQTPIDKRKTDALKSMIGLMNHPAPGSSFTPPNSQSSSSNIFSYEVVQNNAAATTQPDLLRTPPPLKSQQKNSDSDSSEFNQPMSFAVIESGDDNVSPSSRILMSPPARNTSFNLSTVPRNLFGRGEILPQSTLLSPGAFASTTSDGRSSISSSHEDLPAVKMRNGPLFPKLQNPISKTTPVSVADVSVSGPAETGSHVSSQFERDVMKRTLIKLIEEDKDFMASFHTAYMAHMAKLRS